MNWTQLKEISRNLLASKNLSQYSKRLEFELQEIETQGANAYWLNLVETQAKFADNPNKLLLPWLHGMIINDINPLTDPADIITSTKFKDIKQYYDTYGKLPIGITKDTDMPDIDIDCLPMARDEIKKFAMNEFSKDSQDEYGMVCSVGAWQTFKFKAALRDVSSAIGACHKNEIFELTKNLPDEVDDLKEGGYATCKGKIKDADGNEKDCKKSHRELKCPRCGSPDTESPTIAKLLNDYTDLKKFYDKYTQVVEYAVNLIGRVQHIGMHAGAIIIADRDLFGNIPMAKNKNNPYWVSMWTEGRNTQLSKFGFTKWDILGLKTLEYIYECCGMLRHTKGIYFGEKSDDPTYIPMNGWDVVDPTFKGERDGFQLNGIGGYFYKNDQKHWISLNDHKVLKTAKELKTDTVFQFDTELAKSILKNGTPKSFDDLMLLSAMGHPGPMECCAPYSKVLTDTGYVEIQHINNAHKIAYIDNDENMKFTDKFLIGESGEKEIFEIETEDGNMLPLSADHLVLTPNGFIKVKDLQENDDICLMPDVYATR